MRNHKAAFRVSAAIVTWLGLFAAILASLKKKHRQAAETKALPAAENPGSKSRLP